VYVHTGRGENGTPDSAHLYWRSGNSIWNNDKDTATLRSASRTYDTCGWTKPGTGTSSCGFKARPATTQPKIKPTRVKPESHHGADATTVTVTVPHSLSVTNHAARDVFRRTPSLPTESDTADGATPPAP
jgi:hypothetical protein